MVEIKEELCIGCEACTRDCPAGMTMENGKAVPLKRCIQCGHCVAVCPKKALSIPEYDTEDMEEYEEGKFNLDPDQFLRSVKFRRSIRHFKDKKIEKKKLERVLQAGRYTATGKNKQDVTFTVIQDNLDEFKDLAWEGWLQMALELEAKGSRASAYFMKQYEVRKKDPSDDALFFNSPAMVITACDYELNAALAAANIENMAVAEGLGVLYNGFGLQAIQKSEAALEWLNLDKKIVCCLLIGYPDVIYRRTAPRKKADIVWK